MTEGFERIPDRTRDECGDAGPIARAALDDRPYADPGHPGNRLRPRVRCYGCGVLGCTTAWGNWCLPCNVARIDRISGFLESELARLSTPPVAPVEASPRQVSQPIREDSK